MPACSIYRSEKKDSTYLYLAEGVSFEDLPAELRARFGAATEVMQLDLEANTRLAQADAKNVLQALEDPGYYLQLPPEVSVEELLNRSFS
jgi:uncharacterized protein YcgL (UPF0745 family)